MSELTPITREEALLDGQDLTPITRQEMFIKHIYDASQQIPEPITREEWFLKKAAEGGGGGDITVESLSVTENGTYTAPSGKAYTPVNVNVPLPANAYLLEEVTDGDLTSAKSKPLPSVSVAVTEADELDVFVGDSETIVSDNEPYIYRQSKGGRMVSERLVGASVAWNQLINVPSTNISKTENGVTFTDNRDGTISVQTDANGATGNAYIALNASVSVTSGHKYLFSGTPSGGSVSTYYSYPINIDLGVGRVYDLGNGIAFNPSNNGTVTIVLAYVKAGTVIANAIKFKAQLFDLTLMFGSTIADYVYSLERSTAGSGIAWLKSYGFFSEDYYAYDSGSLKSVSVSEKKVRDASNNVIATYPLPSSDLRGLYKLASNKLQADGDIQYGDGWRLRRYGIVDLGTLDWNYNSEYTMFYAPVSDMSAERTKKGLNPKYQIVDFYVTDPSWATSDKIMTLYAANSVVRVKDTSFGGDKDAFKTAMSGVYLIYELATPVWEKTSPFTNPQTVGSTEEFVANLPVGHESKYYDGDIHHSYIYAGDARAKVTGDVDIVNGTAPNGTCSVCVVMPDGDEIWSDAGDVTAEIWT